MENNLLAMWETWVRSLGWEDTLEEGMATHSSILFFFFQSSILAWRIPMDRGAWWATVHGVTKSQTRLSTHKNTRMGCHALLQGIFLTQGSNPCL